MTASDRFHGVLAEISQLGDVWSHDGREWMHQYAVARLLPWWARRWLRPWWERQEIAVRFRPFPSDPTACRGIYWNGGTLTLLWPSITGRPYLQRSMEIPGGQHWSAWLADQHL